MQALDLPIIVLTVGLFVLCGALVLMRLPLPRVVWRPFWRRSRGSIPVAHRRVVTGRAPTLATVAAPARHFARTPDVRVVTEDVHRAEQMIEHYLDADPAILASVMATWIVADDTNNRIRNEARRP